MSHDVMDAARWAVRQGIAPRDKIALMGASYGGFVVLWGLAFEPDLFACGLDMVGESNLLTSMDPKNMPPYWRGAVADQYTKALGVRLGTEEGERRD